MGFRETWQEETRKLPDLSSRGLAQKQNLESWKRVTPQPPPPQRQDRTLSHWLRGKGTPEYLKMTCDHFNTKTNTAWVKIKMLMRHVLQETASCRSTCHRTQHHQRKCPHCAKESQSFYYANDPTLSVYCDYQLSDETLSLLWPPASFGSLSF